MSHSGTRRSAGTCRTPGCGRTAWSAGKYICPQCRFLSLIDRSGDCWLWMRNTNAKGYGLFQSAKTETFASALAHRIMWEIVHGVPDPDLVVMHNCDTPACVNPAHLRLGTIAENQEDMARKGRSGNRRLSDAQLIAAFHDPRPNTVIARELGVTKHAIRHLKQGRTYKHLHLLS